MPNHWTPTATVLEIVFFALNVIFSAVNFLLWVLNNHWQNFIVMALNLAVAIYIGQNIYSQIQPPKSSNPICRIPPHER